MTAYRRDITFIEGSTHKVKDIRAWLAKVDETWPNGAVDDEVPQFDDHRISVQYYCPRTI
jgi:hypothetical protein